MYSPNKLTSIHWEWEEQLQMTMVLGQCWKPHAIMISLPLQGHINPFVSLALKLAARGIVVTFVHLHHVHHRLFKAHKGSDGEPDFFSEARQSGLDIRYTTISDGFPLEFDRDLHFREHWNSLLHDFPKLVDTFVGKLIESLDASCFVHFLVTDTGYFWQAAIAQKYNLVHVSFWTEPALVFSLCYHWDVMIEKGHVPCHDDNGEVEIDYLPGIQSIKTRNLMSYLTDREEPVLVEIFTRMFIEVKKADFILHNTVQELESETLSALSEYQPNYAIGPINFSKGLPRDTVSKSIWSESDCAQWLDTKSPGSVLYVSFGSFVHVAKQEIQEIAYGLLLSGVDFIWVVRAGIVSPRDTTVLPEGYEEKIKEKGLIIPWCDQIGVLLNPAIGGFLTHCGWNSTVESMWCGLPMMCHPVAYDQPTNRKLVVDDWRIGVSLCDGVVVDREGVAEKIRKFMKSEELRRAARIVKEKVQRALENEGSSENNFNQFIKDLVAKLHLRY